MLKIKAQYRLAYRYWRMWERDRDFESSRDYSGSLGCGCIEYFCPHVNECARFADEYDQHNLDMQKDYLRLRETINVYPEILAAALESYLNRAKTYEPTGKYRRMMTRKRFYDHKVSP